LYFLSYCMPRYVICGIPIHAVAVSIFSLFAVSFCKRKPE
jgi:hypothetical protein